MLLIQKKHGFITLTKGEDDIFQDVINELIMCRPNECEAALVKDSETILLSEQKVQKATTMLRNLRKVVAKAHKTLDKREDNMSRKYAINIDEVDAFLHEEEEVG